MTTFLFHRAHPFRTIVLITVIGVLQAPTCHSQDYEADSIYYTPIARPVTVAPSSVRQQRHLFQDTTANPGVHYFFNFQFGHIFGEENERVGREVTITTSTVHGLTLGRKLRAGVGVGFDMYYDWKTLPVFGSVSWDLIGSSRTHAVYVQLNYGWPAGVWRAEPPWDPEGIRVQGGRMFSPQIGYRINYREMRLSLSVGAKMQHLETIYESPSYYYLPDGTITEGAPNRTTVSMDITRFMVNVSFGWR